MLFKPLPCVWKVGEVNKNLFPYYVAVNGNTRAAVYHMASAKCEWRLSVIKLQFKSSNFELYKGKTKLLYLKNVSNHNAVFVNTGFWGASLSCFKTVWMFIYEILKCMKYGCVQVLCIPKAHLKVQQKPFSCDVEMMRLA